MVKYIKIEGGVKMANELRFKCSCGNVVNTLPGAICKKCKQPFDIPGDGMIYLYRKGSPFGFAGGFGLYINGEAYGQVGNRETLRIPVKYGTYNIHVAAGMNRRCNDMVLNITPETRFGFLKVWMRPGFWTNSFVLEPSTPEEIPNK